LNISIVFHLGSFWLLNARSLETKLLCLRTRCFKQWLISPNSMPIYISLVAVSETVKEDSKGTFLASKERLTCSGASTMNEGKNGATALKSHLVAQVITYNSPT
jgi:hypothetical protein